MLKFHNSYVYRTPLRTVDSFSDGKNYETVDAYLKVALGEAAVQEAIYVSSPDFYAEIEEFLTGDFYEKADPKKVNKFRVTALKYLNRMSYRATPYGYFAGVGSGKVLDSGAPKFTLGDLVFNRVALLDAAYLMYFANEFIKEQGVVELLSFFPNNMIFSAGNKSRYVEYIDADRGRAYNLSVFTNSEYTDRVLAYAKNGALGKDLANLFIGEDVSPAEGMAFVQQLIDAKILISELEPQVVGQNFQSQLLGVFEKLLNTAAPSSEVYSTVIRYQNYLVELIQQLDKVVKDGKIRDYREIHDMVKAFHGQPYKNVIRLDTAIETEKMPPLDFNLARHIQKGLMAFTRFCSVSSNPSIASFREKFSERYEEQFVPVLLALDPELGIGFENVGSEMFSFAPLVDNLPMTPRLETTMKKKMEWDFGIHSFFMGKIMEAVKEGNSVINLTEEDLGKFSYDVNHLPPTSAALLKLVPKPGQDNPLVVFQDLGKDTGAALVSRFAHLSPEINQVLTDLCEIEDKAFPGRAVAEVNHLANTRIGNITERPRSRKFEIGFITKSNSREEGMIPVQDIYVGIRNNRVVLVNQQTGQEIIPRVSTAHNYAYNCLPIYKFMACLQEEYHQGYYEYTLNLGNIPSMVNFVPRIQFEDFVFRPATWKIPTHPIRKIKEQSFEDFHAQLRELFAAEGWPTVFNVSENGTPVHIDINNHLGAFLLANMVGSPHIFAAEVIGGEANNQWLQNKSGGYHHEILLPFRNDAFDTKPAAGIRNIIKDIPGVHRSVVPSDEWLYLKIYAGTATVEKIISERLPLLIANWKQESLINGYFFLRLTDPDYHLRLRVKPSGYAAIGRIMEVFNNFFAPELESGFIQKVQFDTYRREVERYGGPLIVPSEELFIIDSELVINLKTILVAEVNKDYEWLLMFKVVTLYMEVFGLQGASAIQFLKERSATFSAIFNTNKLQKRSLIQRYLNNQQVLEQMMNHVGTPFADQLSLLQAIEQFRGKLSAWYDKHLAAEPQEIRNELLRSYIHMFILRFSSGKNKLHEHVLFFFLERYYLQQRQRRSQLITSSIQ